MKKEGYGSTNQVDQVLLGYCTGRSFDLSRLVQPQGQLGQLAGLVQV
jgi:hypothetical protein